MITIAELLRFKIFKIMRIFIVVLFSFVVTLNAQDQWGLKKDA